MFTNITRTTLCITAFSIASLMAAPLNATKTESLDWNWKFARFGKMPDGSTQPEPGKAMGFATATSEESGNPADNAVTGTSPPAGVPPVAKAEKKSPWTWDAP